MPSEWINFVKQFAEEHNISYRDALSEASESYNNRLFWIHKENVF